MVKVEVVKRVATFGKQGGANRRYDKHETIAQGNTATGNPEDARLFPAARDDPSDWPLVWGVDEMDGP
ncbi:hypothetical protein ACLOJK_013536 [Asimina triloba]